MISSFLALVNASEPLGIVSSLPENGLGPHTCVVVY